MPARPHSASSTCRFLQERKWRQHARAVSVDPLRAAHDAKSFRSARAPLAAALPHAPRAVSVAISCSSLRNASLVARDAHFHAPGVRCFFTGGSSGGGGKNRAGANALSIFHERF